MQEGAAYALDRFAWTGNAVIAAKELDSLMQLKSGEVANVLKLDDGLRRVSTAYGKQGYVMAHATYTPQLNDDTKKAVFDIAIEEGPQFHFGTLTFPGLAPDGAAILSSRWKLKAGDVFDATYPSQFFLDEIRTRLKQGTTPPSIRSKVDKEKHIVDVSFVFGGAQ